MILVTAIIIYLGIQSIQDNAPAPQNAVLTIPYFSNQDQGYDSVSKNSEWQPIIETIGGVEMVLVPTGCFMMGDTQEDSAPIHEVCIEEPFWLDRTEVSRANYKRFMNPSSDDEPSLSPEFPIIDLTWFDAQELCSARGMRLPTEAEWEYAARGVDSVIYPWGDEWLSGRIATELSRVGSIANNASWVGALDMSGNVLEWTQSIYSPYPYTNLDGRNNMVDADAPRVLRGSDYLHTDPQTYRLSNRFWYFPLSGEGFGWGVRCAAAVNPSSG